MQDVMISGVLEGDPGQMAFTCWLPLLTSGQYALASSSTHGLVAFSYQRTVVLEARHAWSPFTTTWTSSFQLTVYR